MAYKTIVSIEELRDHIEQPDWAIVDCRFSLLDTEKGRRDYLSEHIPGAVYAHLDNDLSAPAQPGITGRHPLPKPDFMEGKCSSWGISGQTQVVVYDDMGGAIAARLWWLLNWLGHEAVALLDGGWQRWKQQDLSLRSGNESRPPSRFRAVPRPDLVVETAGVESRTAASAPLLDARGLERYRGEVEPIDPVAGHIPGAIPAPFSANLNTEGTLLSPSELRERFVSLLGMASIEETICYCGSGVTAAHNLLAMLHAGLGMGRLYVGSWSEWVTDPSRPIATGDEGQPVA